MWAAAYAAEASLDPSRSTSAGRAALGTVEPSPAQDRRTTSIWPATWSGAVIRPEPSARLRPWERLSSGRAGLADRLLGDQQATCRASTTSVLGLRRGAGGGGGGGGGAGGGGWGVGGVVG